MIVGIESVELVLRTTLPAIGLIAVIGNCLFSHAII
jgi:hypothetical protein